MVDKRRPSLSSRAHRGRDVVAIPANRPLALVALLLAVAALVFLVLVGSNDSERLKTLRIPAIVLISAATVPVLLRFRPGPSVVLASNELRVRRAFSQRCVAYRDIVQVSDVGPRFRIDRWLPMLNPLGSIANECVVIYQRDQPPLKVVDLDVAMPLESFRSLVVERVPKHR